MSTVEENTKMIWNILITQMKNKYNFDIQTNPVCRRLFQETVESSYEHIKSFGSVVHMNKLIIEKLLIKFLKIRSSSSEPTTTTNQNIHKQRHILHCLIDDDTHTITNHTNFGHIKQMQCKTIELYDCCVQTYTNELQLKQNRFLHEYLVIFLDIYMNNKLVGENIVLTQQQCNKNKILFTSDIVVPYDDICTKIQFILKDANMNPLSFQYNITIRTVIAGHMLSLDDSVPTMLKESTYFSFLINTGNVQSGDILMLHDKELYVLATGIVNIQNKNAIRVTELTNVLHNAFFCKLDNKFKLPNIPNKILLKNKSKLPIICIECS